MHDFRSYSAGGRAGEPLWTIRDMADHYGLTLRALRFYEDRKLIRSHRDGITRLYDAETRRRLEVIIKGKQLGFTLTEIRDLIEASNGSGTPVIDLALDDAQIVEQIRLLKQQRESIDRAIAELAKAQQQRMPGPWERRDTRGWPHA